MAPKSVVFLLYRAVRNTFFFSKEANKTKVNLQNFLQSVVTVINQIKL